MEERPYQQRSAERGVRSAKCNVDAAIWTEVHRWELTSAEAEEAQRGGYTGRNKTEERQSRLRSTVPAEERQNGGGDECGVPDRINNPS